MSPTTRLTLDSGKLDEHCCQALSLCRLSRGAEHWPGPTPPWTMGLEEEEGKEQQGCLAAVCQRFPPSYADRLLFAHAVQSIATRSLFPWLSSFAGDLLYFEAVLHMEPGESYYRDHYVHPLEVGCIGEALLELEIEGKPLWKILLQSFKEMLAPEKEKEEEGEVESEEKGENNVDVVGRYLRECGVSPEELDRGWLMVAWWVAALYHDIGYFPQKSCVLFGQKLERAFTHGWSSLTERLSQREQRDDLVWRQVRTWRDEHEHLQGLSAEELMSLMCERDHPGLAAITTSALCRRLLQYTSLYPADFCAYQVAAHAILCHDHTGLAREMRRARRGEESGTCLFQLRYSENPLAALLVLCDQLSEFHRERLLPVEGRSAKEVGFREVRLWKKVDIKVDIKVTGKTLKVRFIPAPGVRRSPEEHISDLQHFLEDKRWFLTCDPPKGQKPYLLMDGPFNVMVDLKNIEKLVRGS